MIGSTSGMGHGGFQHKGSGLCSGFRERIGGPGSRIPKPKH